MSVTVYKIDPMGTEPTPIECEVPGFPNRDAEGDVMYENSHFATLAEAWEAQRRDCAADVSLAGRDVQRARATLRKVEQDAATAAVRFQECEEKHRAFLASTPTPEVRDAR